MNQKTQSPRPLPASADASPTRPLRPVVSAVLPKGTLVELVFDPVKKTAGLAVWDGHKVHFVSQLPDGPDRLVPAREAEALARHRVVKFASGAESYGETEDLLAAIRSHIHRYVDLPAAFEQLAALYVLMTWVHDRFEELPYLRRRGEFGTGKTRFLITLGNLCYKPIFAAGASTVSPLFHLIDRIGGTLILDEADFRFSDERALIAKILNNGNVRGFPVLRSESPNGRDFRPRAFEVFGPKIAAMRGRYDDPALESRFLTETASGAAPRADIPINLPPDQEEAAQRLRNRLLLWRFRNHGQITARQDERLDRFEPRLRQILTPLLSVAAEEEDIEAILIHAEAVETGLKETRGQSVEAEVLTVTRCLLDATETAGASVQAIARLHGEVFLGDAARAMNARSMGHILRVRLNLPTRKSHGVFIVPREAGAAVAALCARYGVTKEDAERLNAAAGIETRVEYGDEGDVSKAA